MWLPLLPRPDGLGYELVHADTWRPSDYASAAQLSVPLNTNSSLVSGLSAVEADWLQEQLAAKQESYPVSD